MSRPAWYRTARNLGGAYWVPFEVANALQQQLEAYVARLQQAEEHLLHLRQELRRSAAELQDVDALRRRAEQAVQEAAQARAEAEQARQDARAAAEHLAQKERQRAGPDPAALDALRADLANLRRHTAEQITLGIRQERVERLTSLAHLHDDLERAREHFAGQQDVAEAVLAMLHRVRAELRRGGAEPFGQAGDRFDPRRHEAVATAPSETFPEGTLFEVLQVGFALDDGLVRPARVVVSSG